MKKLLSLMIIGIMIFSLIACGSRNSENTASQETENAPAVPEKENEASRDADSADGTDSSAGAKQEETGSDSESGSEGNSILVAYFSLAGEQYKVGVVEEGNTAVIAKMIAEQTGADIFSIESTSDYPDTYDGLLEVSREEESNPPQIAGTVENMDDYEIIFVGYPIWWGNLPPIMEVFLDNYDFSGKTVVPFCTHAGSGLSGTESAISDITGADMMDGLAISGETAQNQRDKAGEAVTEWLREGGFIE